MKLFNFPITTIFAREVLEAALVVGQFRTVVLRSPEWEDPEKRREGLRAITNAAIIASLVALVIVVAVSVPLVIKGNDLDPKIVQIIEGISKLVAAVCVGELSLKIPKWLGVYDSKKDKVALLESKLTLGNIRFNVAWNLWREVAETGVYLIPFLLTDEWTTIPLSGAVGIILSSILGYAIYYSNQQQKSMKWLAIITAATMGILSVGLFTGGCHEMEKALGMTHTVWTLDGDFWSTDRLPMTIFKPFGYSSSRTVLQMVAFWTWLILLVTLHYLKFRSLDFDSEKLSSSEDGDEVNGEDNKLVPEEKA